MAKAQKQEMTFEQAMSELEAIVAKMEAGSLTLEDSVQAYSRGKELAKFCRDKLNAAEAKIRQCEADGLLTDVSVSY